MPEGHQSPPPERQTGRQLNDVPGSGQGIDNVENKEQTNESQVNSLESNPSWPRDQIVKEKFSKTLQ
ncbi:hypothetical protein MKZ38_000456 [Zalerion maritima]|uniref:Uncharacterized protein n=1 Tax=Zalerion maritima TaxID=339359 RepID=A0AAD5WV61_9PEZI|nr:hypothetical protein MKZ38_000456 [Zalerion maritima]